MNYVILKHNNVPEEVIVKLQLLDIAVTYADGQDWFTGEPAPWYADDDELYCPHMIWPDRVAATDTSPDKITMSKDWCASFKTIEELIEAVILYRQNNGK